MLSSIIIVFRNLWRRLLNAWRGSSRHPVGWVRLEISGALPELADEPPWWQARFAGARAPLSLQLLRRRFERIRAGKAQGVVLVIREFGAGWATIQSLHAIIAEHRATGGRVIAYLEGGGSRSYLAACAAEALVMPPTAGLNLLGLRVEATFLADTLRMVGIEAEVIAVSPYKSGGDQFTRAQISPEAYEQLARITDERFALLVETVAKARQLSEAHVQALIDGAPYQGSEAVAVGLLDAVCYEDELEAWLRRWLSDEAAVAAVTATASPDAPNAPAAAAAATASSDAPAAAPSAVAPAAALASPDAPNAAAAPSLAPNADDDDDDEPPLILTWTQALRRLPIPLIRRERRYIGVVRVEGAISTGSSQRSPLPIPLFGGEMAGSESITQALRQAERNRKVAAVVLYVDSPGGDAFASDLIWREVLRLSQRKPVVVSMGDVAASGGYYIAAPAHMIYAQPATLTGSIGVFTLRPNLGGLLERAQVGTTVISRGANSGIFASNAPLTPTERATLVRGVATTYAEFTQRVTAGRTLTEAQLEPIAGGRVWSGRAALEHGLVDALGGLPEAVAHARTLAHLPPDPLAPLMIISGGGKGRTLPRPFPSAPPAPNDLFVALLSELRQTRTLAALPWVIREEAP